jgi:hypothetical protein
LPESERGMDMTDQSPAYDLRLQVGAGTGSNSSNFENHLNTMSL